MAHHYLAESKEPGGIKPPGSLYARVIVGLRNFVGLAIVEARPWASPYRGDALVGLEPACYNVLMKMPHGDQALVDDAKLREYVLNPLHPVGKHHAVLFERLLGIDRGNAGILKEALLSAAANEDVTREGVTPYGLKCEVRFLLSGPRASKRVVSVWIVEEGSDRPRLVTCYVE